MRADRKELVGEVFCDVFEKVAFMFGEEAGREELSEAATEFIQAAMSFKGPFEGNLAIVVPDEMCPEIAANVLGMDLDDEIVKDQATDALKEVLNVICGNLLTEIAGEEPIFDLSVPLISKIDEAGWAAILDRPDAVGFLVDETPVVLMFSSEDDIG